MSKKPRTTGQDTSTLPGHTDEDCVALAHQALLEITTLDTFQGPAVVTRGEGVVTVEYPTTQPGYPGWMWTIALSDLPDIAPSVLELSLLPGAGSLLSPDWIPWAERMEEFLANEKATEAAQAFEEEDDDDDDDDVDFDDDVNGIDIDQLDLDLDPAPLEIPIEPTDVFDHVEFDEPDPLDP
jgi:hypothetical protein